MHLETHKEQTHKEIVSYRLREPNPEPPTHRPPAVRIRYAYPRVIGDDILTLCIMLAVHHPTIDKKVNRCVCVWQAAWQWVPDVLLQSSLSLTPNLLSWNVLK